MSIRDEAFFWGVWVLIPLMWEIAGGFLSGIIIIVIKLVPKKGKRLDYYPSFSILIPVYNSSATLKACLDSIANQEYDLSKIEIRILNNQKQRDESYNIFSNFQKDHPAIKVWWHDTHAGKAKALNLGVSNSHSEYVLNIDSDGWLDSKGLESLVIKFESDPKIRALTGVVLIDPKLIEKTKNQLLKTWQRCEMFEYTESFLVGRNIASTFNSMYTLAGACSAFRRSSLAKTRLYNFDTVGEDTDMTFQLKDDTKGKVVLCQKCFFYVDPIESFDKMYTQRQRWQRGQLEVAYLYQKQHTGHIFNFFSKSSFRCLMSDHTLALPRLIWMFGIIYLYFLGYPLKILIGSNLILYGLYVMNSILYFLVAILLLNTQHFTRKYAMKSWWIIPILPLYRSVIYWMRLAGIINSISSTATWTTLTLSKEMNVLKRGLDKSILNKVKWIKNKLEEEFNNGIN